jgi:hypothetical protein
MAFDRPPGLFGRALRAISLLMAFAAAFALAPPAEAMLAVEATVQQLVAESDMAVDATPEESYSDWEDIPKVGRRIVTYTRMRVSDAAFGDVPSDVWVRTLGGHVGDVGQRVEGEAEFSKGSRALVFLRRAPDGRFRVTQMSQGHFRVDGAGAIAKLRATVRLSALIKAKKGLGARTALEGLGVADALEALRHERRALGK